MDLRLSTGRRRLLLFVLLSVTVCAVLNPGNFGTIDTLRRLQVARWIRLGEPPVSPEDTRFGIAGRGGVRHPWYGIGQSLLLIPFDAIVGATVVPALDRFGLEAGKQRQVAVLLIAFLMQSFVTACSLAVAYEVLILFQFAPAVSTAGTLALLFGTLYLQYVQSAQENNLLLLLALCALWGVLRWQREDRARWAAFAGAACGFAILVRLPSVLETGVFLMFAVSTHSHRKRFLAAYLPPVAAALVLDRWYHWYRFGELFSTYMGIFGRQFRPVGGPAAFPFSYPFWKGFFGTFFSPDKSVFLFDPLLVVLVFVAAWTWRRMHLSVRHAIVWLALLLLLYTALYASYIDFGGDVAWGHRFVTLPVQLLSLLAVPLLLTFAGSLPGSLRRIAWALVFAAIILQAASTVLGATVEVMQREMGYDKGVIVNRAINLAQLATDREDGRRFAGIPKEWRSVAYLPFQLRIGFPGLARWAIAVWIALLVIMCILVAATLRAAYGSG
jgi:hypothetical protein